MQVGPESSMRARLRDLLLGLVTGGSPGGRGSESELRHDCEHADGGTRCEPGGQPVKDQSATALGLDHALLTQYA